MKCVVGLTGSPYCRDRPYHHTPIAYNGATHSIQDLRSLCEPLQCRQWQCEALAHEAGTGASTGHTLSLADCMALQHISLQELGNSTGELGQDIEVCQHLMLAIGAR